MHFYCEDVSSHTIIIPSSRALIFETEVPMFNGFHSGINTNILYIILARLRCPECRDDMFHPLQKPKLIQVIQFLLDCGAKMDNCQFQIDDADLFALFVHEDLTTTCPDSRGTQLLTSTVKNPAALQFLDLLLTRISEFHVKHNLELKTVREIINQPIFGQNSEPLLMLVRNTEVFKILVHHDADFTVRSSKTNHTILMQLCLDLGDWELFDVQPSTIEWILTNVPESENLLYLCDGNGDQVLTYLAPLQQNSTLTVALMLIKAGAYIDDETEKTYFNMPLCSRGLVKKVQSLILEKRRQQFLSFCMALHPKLGAESAASVLNCDVLSVICQNVSPRNK